MIKVITYREDFGRTYWKTMEEDYELQLKNGWFPVHTQALSTESVMIIWEKEGADTTT